VATPFCSGVEPMVAEPSINVTTPVGTPPADVTAAMKVTGWCHSVVSRSCAMVVVVVAAFGPPPPIALSTTSLPSPPL